MALRKGSDAPPRDTVVALSNPLREAGVCAAEDSRTGLETTHDGPDVTICGAYRVDVRRPASSVGQTPLHVCAKHGQAEVLSRSLLASPLTDVNAKDEDGRTALHLACRGGHDRCVDPLIRAGIDVSAVDSGGCTALHLAVKYRHIKIAQDLVSHSSSCLALTDSNLRTPLHDAVLTGSEHLCRLMMQSGAIVHAKEAFGRTPLMLACSARLVNVVSCLFDEYLASGSAAGAPHPAADEDKEGALAIHYAVLCNYSPLVELVAKHTADISKAMRCGSTAVHMAASRGYRDTLEILIGAGAQVNAVDAGGATPLHRASSHNRLACVELLLHKGADVSIRDDKGRTASHLAALTGHATVLVLLLRLGGAQQLVGDTDLQMPLHYACSSAHANCVGALLTWASGQSQGMLHSLLYAADSTGRISAHCAAAQPGGSAALALLLQHGGSALANANECEMKTPLHFAAEHNCPENVELLLAHEADIAATDLEGRTALHLACMHGCESAVALLLSKGASSCLRESWGRQPLLLASEAAHAGVIRLLLAGGCDVNGLDGLKCSALHLACTADAEDVVRLLIDAGCDLQARDSTGATPLQRAICSRSSQAAAAILMHDKWQIAMGSVDGDGFSPMRSLIENLPTVAKIVLDKCVAVRNACSIVDADTTVIHDYRYIDPHPDDPCCSQKKQWFVQTMAELHEVELLFHPLTQSNITYKWSRFGMFFHWLRFATFLGYLALLTAYTFAAPGIAAAQLFDVYGCPISNTSDSNAPVHFVQYSQPVSVYTIPSKDNALIILQTLLLTISVVYFAQEVVDMFILRQGYLLKASSYVNLLMIGTTIGFTSPPGFYPCLRHWRCGWIANLSVWATLVLFLSSFDFVGIYVIMFTAVTKSLLKLMVLLTVFFLGFSVVFNLLHNEQTQYESLPNSLLSALDMAMGEINLSSNFLGATNVFAKDSLWAVAIFMFLINIVLFNLTIGVTIGDIEEMRASARFQIMAQKVKWLHRYETNLPIALRRHFYTKEYVKEVSTASPAKSRVVSELQRINDSLAVPLLDAKPQQCSLDDLKVELRDLKVQIAMLATVVKDLSLQPSVLSRSAAGLGTIDLTVT